jgi:hypothetical protein
MSSSDFPPPPGPLDMIFNDVGDYTNSVVFFCLVLLGKRQAWIRLGGNLVDAACLCFV